MPVTVTRYGGVMAMKPKSRRFDMNELDPAQRAALDQLGEVERSAAPQQRMPDGFVYSFSIEGERGVRREIEIAGPSVPDALKTLLP